MNIQDKCLPCLVGQIVKIADLTEAHPKEELYKKAFHCLGDMDFSQTTPEIMGNIFELMKDYTNIADPYLDIRLKYNKLFLELSEQFATQIEAAPVPFEQAVTYAAIGNIIDFSPGHNYTIDEILGFFDASANLTFAINHLDQLTQAIKNSKRLLYLGDNCGEICLDKLLIQQIKKLNPDLHISFGVRGKPVVNDSIEDDAYLVGIDEYADIISNGDGSQGTILHRTSQEFQQVYQEADFIISKGQANYETLSEEKQKDIFYLLITKCNVIAEDIGVPVKSLICMKK